MLVHVLERTNKDNIPAIETTVAFDRLYCYVHGHMVRVSASFYRDLKLYKHMGQGTHDSVVGQPRIYLIPGVQLHYHSHSVTLHTHVMDGIIFYTGNCTL
jgi:hypothetical protein